MGNNFQNYEKFRKQTNHKFCQNARKIWTWSIRKWTDLDRHSLYLK
ncbi:hypothetical protein KMAL_31260 [Novacetimonas maltaceti]|uniref:Uncharacterized protein n=2 Tax=Acetobacteraceae TaxID=433 RepID=A0A2S3VX91_9PROT|nr:hypothetical protein KMAL_31260 [Novacetimonas maltaceti]